MLRGVRGLVCIGSCLMLLGGAVTGCGSDDDGDSAGTSSSTQAASTKKQVKVAYVVPSLNNEAFKAEVDSAEAAAKADGNVTYSVEAGTTDTDVTGEIALLRAALTKNPDAVIVHVDDPKAMKSPLAAAVKRTKVIVVGQPVEDIGATNVTFSDLAGGEAAGKFMAENVPNGSQIGILSCFPGQYQSIEDRVNGAKSQWGDKDYKIVATLDAQCDSSKGRAAMAALLTSHPEVDGVFSVSDSQTAGAVSAVKQAKKDPFIVSFDAQPSIVQLVETGVVGGTVDRDTPGGSKKAMELALAAVRDGAAPTTVTIQPKIVSKENASSASGG